MKKGTLTKDQVIALVGADAVAQFAQVNCEPTGRCGYNGALQGDGLTEWSASVTATDVDGDDVTLIAYYYTTDDDDDDDDDDCPNHVWAIEGYEIA